MTSWYSYTPADTVFCKGAEPMEMGMDHTANSIFPPPVETISGALRAEVLRQNSVSIKGYKNKECDKGIISSIGECGSPAPFRVFGPLFRKDGRFLVPAPYSWFAEKDLLKKRGTVPVYKGSLMDHSLVSTDLDSVLWVKGEGSELSSLGGFWVDKDSLSSGAEKMDVWMPEDLFDFEERTGIGLDFSSENNCRSTSYRTVRTGHLYTFYHSRLKPDVELVFGVDTELPLQNEGCLNLGGEKRFGRYCLLSPAPQFKDSGDGYFQTLSLIPYSEESASKLVATGKPVRLGGWDMNRGFHKPMRNYMPAGTVFTEKIDINLVAI